MTKKSFMTLTSTVFIFLGLLFGMGMELQSTPEVSNVALTLLYDDIPDINLSQQIVSLNLEQWMNVGQDTDSFKTGVLNIQEIMKILDKSPGGQLPKWMMLDAEDPFFSDLLKDPTSPEFKRAQSSLISAIRTLKARYPNTKWSLYGIPNLPYWVEKKGWATATTEERRKMLESIALASAPIVAELDWVSASIYDVYDPSMVIAGSPQSIQGTPESVREDGRAWRMASVSLSVLLAKGKPVIPMIFPFWAPGGVAPYCQVINPREFMEDVILPAIKSGAQGFALWATMTYQINKVTKFDKNPDVQTKEKDFGAQAWRKAFTVDYLGGKSPVNWDDPTLKQILIRKTSQTLLDTLRNIRMYEKIKTLPNSTLP